MVLLNGGVNTWTSWKPQLPYLTEHFDVLAPTIAGNVGGPPLPEGEFGIEVWADAAEEAMDGVGFKQAHLAGYSAGGWIAMELVNRGRALSAYAFAPAGGWAEQRSLDRVGSFFQVVKSAAKTTRHVAPLLTWSSVFRHNAVRGSNAHGERMPRAAMNRLFHELAASELPDVLSQQRLRFDLLEPMEDPGVPVTIAWPEKDLILPYQWYGVRWREVAPFAEWKFMSDIGHMPNYDEPELIAREIMAAAARATGDAVD